MQVLVNKFELVRDGVTYKAGSVVDLPDDVIKQIVDGVKTKVDVDGLKDKLGGLGGLFGGNK